MQKYQVCGSRGCNCRENVSLHLLPNQYLP
ncbi:unnamed protein product [Staurois parvus]|uniref:Uncharacterized protein n=1 Tax=Staurois parvus TaxID=386267 RepID=A0ABN9AQB8_9NEOB|nr:unnamed protein product [Staurois parvus]